MITFWKKAVLCCLIKSMTSRLIFVATQFRHGARAPLDLDSSYKDLQKQSWDNPGELTKIGKRMQYLLGRRNAKRYITEEKLLSENFDPHEILIRSTDVNRTIESALVQLQGLYPQTNEKLNAEEAKLAEDIEYDVTEFVQEINKTDGSDYPIPSGINTPPIHIFDNTERLIRTFEIDPCTDKVKDQKVANLNLSNVVNITERFNEKYGEKMAQFFNDTNGTQYQFTKINSFCDGYLSGKADGRSLAFLQLDGINDTELGRYCLDVFDVNVKDYVFGDENGTIARIEGSRNFGYIRSLMKNRIDADINGVDVAANKLDYTRPKLYMQSAHDSTLGGMEVYIQKTFGHPFITPGFAAQAAFEVYTDKTANETKTENDYHVRYMFDDQEIFDMAYPEFVNKLESNFWNDDQINQYCNTSSPSDDNTSNNTSGNNTTNNTSVNNTTNNTSGNTTDNNGDNRDNIVGREEISKKTSSHHAAIAVSVALTTVVVVLAATVITITTTTISVTAATTAATVAGTGAATGIGMGGSATGGAAAAGIFNSSSAIPTASAAVV